MKIHNKTLIVILFIFVASVNASRCQTGTPPITAPPCCENSFAPMPGKKYILSAWVKQDLAGAVNYPDPQITLLFSTLSNGTVFKGPYLAKGLIIDGWQRIEEVFTVPSGAQDIQVNLKNAGGDDVFFDDVRIYPVDGNMKSFVYDPVTLRLMAELDERNYATLYEYDEEGALVRVKKETEKGIMTIKESRNVFRKQ